MSRPSGVFGTGGRYTPENRATTASGWISSTNCWNWPLISVPPNRLDPATARETASTCASAKSSMTYREATHMIESPTMSTLRTGAGGTVLLVVVVDDVDVVVVVVVGRRASSSPSGEPPASTTIEARAARSRTPPSAAASRFWSTEPA
jgi:hypothetical protein